jgi:exosortase
LAASLVHSFFICRSLSNSAATRQTCVGQGCEPIIVVPQPRPNSLARTIDMATAQTKSDSIREVRDLGSRQIDWRLFWVALLIVSIPMMIPYLSHLWSIDSYRFFPFAFLAVGALIYARWDREFHAPRGWGGWLTIALGLMCITLGVLLPTKWLAAVGFVAFCGALLASMRGPADRSLVGLVLPLVLLIRLPLGYDQLLVIQLQSITSGLASVFLDLLAIPHAVANNVITLATRELFVAEACSGIQSVFTLTFIATLLVIVHRRPLWLTPVYIVIAILLAVAANTARVTTVAVGEAWFALDWATGWQHELVGYIALALATLFLLSFDQLITGMLHPIDPHNDVEYEENPLIRLWNYMIDGRQFLPADGETVTTVAGGSGAVAARLQSFLPLAWTRRIFYVLVAVATLGTVTQAVNMQRPRLITRPKELIFSPGAELFDGRLASIRVTGHQQMRGNTDPRLGENADIWTCQIDGTNVESEFVLSQPYRGWHELCICYEASNWMVLNREVQGSNSETGTEHPFEPLAVARFKRDDGVYAYLIYSGFDPSGDVIVPPERPGRLGTRFRDYLYGGDQFERDNVMMLQLFVVVPNKLHPDLLDSLTSDFVELRSILLKQLRTPTTRANREDSGRQMQHAAIASQTRRAATTE